MALSLPTSSIQSALGKAARSTVSAKKIHTSCLYDFDASVYAIVASLVTNEAGLKVDKLARKMMDLYELLLEVYVTITSTISFVMCGLQPVAIPKP